MGAETTVGSIVGYLRLNDDDWRKTIAAAKRDLRELDSQHVDVPVKADASQAKRELKETAAEADALDRKKVEVKVSTEKSRREVSLLGSAIATLAPAMVPLGAASIALGVGLTAAAGTAALAVYGIKQEMKSGTAIGQEYAGQIGILKGDLNDLGHIAASGLLRPFQSVVTDLQQDMPALSGQVGEVSTILGNVAVPAVHGMLSALQALNPLILAAGAASQGMAQDFDRFAQSRGFKDFVSYAASVLPQVVSTVEELAGAAVHVAAAFAPMGMGTLSVLRLIAQVINALPIGLLQTLATTATGVYLAFQSWKGMSNLLETVGGAFGKLATRTGSSAAGMIATAAASGGASLAVGGLGLAVGVATVAWGLYQQHQQEVQQTTQDLSRAIDQDTGAIGEHTRAVIADNVAHMDGIDSLSKYGMSQQQVVDAIAGGGPTLDAMIEKLNEQKSAYADAAKSADAWSTVGRDKVDETAGGMADSMKNLRDELVKAKAQQDLYRQSILEGSQADVDAQNADYNLALAKIDVTKATDDQRKAIDQLNQALDREISKNLQVQGGLTGVAAAERQTIDQLKKSAATTDLNSDAGIKNRQAIEQSVGQLQSYRDTLTKTSGSSLQATAQYNSMSQALLGQIAKTDGANSATYRYAQQLLAIPPDVTTKLGIPGLDTTKYNLSDVLTLLGQINGTTATAYVNVQRNVSTILGPSKGDSGYQGSHSGAQYDEGGYTGAGGKHDEAGTVHRGEVVFSQEDVAAKGGPAKLDAWRRSRLPGYADGGIVGDGAAGYDLSDIFQLISSMAVDPDKLSSAKSAVGSAGKGVSSAQTALNKVLINLEAAQKQLRVARGTKSKKDDIAAEARINRLLQDRAAAYTKLAEATGKAGSAQATYQSLLAASKMSAGQMFVTATRQNNGINQQFINDLSKLRSRGAGPLALQLLTQGDEEAMKIAHSLASGSNAQLLQASSALAQSGSLQSQLENLKNQLNGTNVTAAREANAQLFAMKAQAAQVRYGSTQIQHSYSGPSAQEIASAIVQAHSQSPMQVNAYFDTDNVTSSVMDRMGEFAQRGVAGGY